MRRLDFYPPSTFTVHISLNGDMNETDDTWNKPSLTPLSPLRVISDSLRALTASRVCCLTIREIPLHRHYCYRSRTIQSLQDSFEITRNNYVTIQTLSEFTRGLKMKLIPTKTRSSNYSCKTTQKDTSRRPLNIQSIN